MEIGRINSFESNIGDCTVVGLESILEKAAKIIVEGSQKSRTIPTTKEAVDQIFEEIKKFHDNGNMVSYLEAQLRAQKGT